MVLSIESQDGNWDIVNPKTGEVLANELSSIEAITYLRGDRNVSQRQKV